MQLIQERIKELHENTDFVSALFESLVGYGIIAADFDGNVIAYTIDGSGIHIGKPFHNVGGILAGAPVQIVSEEREKLGEMFEPDNEPE
ncbi:putative Hybrid histidine kinase [groundwater metagenome]